MFKLRFRNAVCVLMILALTGCGDIHSSVEDEPVMSSDSVASNDDSFAESTKQSSLGYIDAGEQPYVSLFQQPDATSVVIARLYTGDAIEVIALEGEWSNISSEGLSGYVQNKNIVFQDSTAIHIETTMSDTRLETSETEVTSTEATSTTLKLNDISYPDNYSYMMSGYVSTKKSNLMMRKQPDSDADYVFSEGIKRGTSVEVYGTGQGTDGTMWYFIKYNGYEGWCKAAYITKDAPPPLQTADTLSYDYIVPDYYLDYPEHCETVVGELNLRRGPGVEYKSYLKIPKGVQLEEIGYNYNNSDWIFTCYNGQYGWAKTYNEGKTYIQFSGGMAKPVIYFYPPNETEVFVKLSLHTSELSTTYPKYRDCWHIIAKPDGSLVNIADGTHHSYLFWDSCNDRTHYDFSTGFCVSGSNTELFLKDKLSVMGLTESEMNDFIVYWLPKMEHNRYNLISFQKENYTDAAELTISPKPDSLLRVFMAFIPLENEIEIAPQKLESFKRIGFSVVEWGGTEIK